MERFIGVLTEHCAGKFPLWLTPDQFAILTVSDRFQTHAETVLQSLQQAGLRGFIDDRTESIGKKIRDNELRKIPYMLILGEKEAENGQVSVRRQGEGDQGSMSISDFVQLIQSQI
jgi:threonyl-tRNA synthetase